MQISGARIRTLKKILPRLRAGASYRLAHRLPDNPIPTLESIGFSAGAEPGQTILPCGNGPTARYNADGRYVARKDLPKQSRYIMTIEWTWEQWDGRYTKTMTEERDIWRDCYQQDFIPPPAVELTYSRQGKQELIVSPAVTTGMPPADLIHLVNLFLELFGRCEIINTDLTPLESYAVKRVNWRLLPPGRYPWDRVSDYLRVLLKDRDDRSKNVIFGRHETIKAYGPVEVYVGEGGFERYVAYVFRSEMGSVVILECTEKDNAIYAFGQDWKDFSKLTKGEILNEGLQLARIVHSEGWQQRFDRFMRTRLAKKAS